MEVPLDRAALVPDEAGWVPVVDAAVVPLLAG